MKVEYIFAVLGIALLALGAAYPFVTLVVDTTGPVIGVTVPENGSTYTSLDKITAYVYDSESGMQSVKCSIGSATYTLSYVSKEPQSPYEIWQYTFSTPITTSGSYNFQFVATNKAGLTSTKTGTFTIYTQLQGTWYIGGVEITSSSQTIYSTATTVSFQFQKTAGIEDTKITCTVVEGTTIILTLTLTDTTNHIWTGSYTFTPGTHNLQLKASDGTTTITYSVVGLTIPGAYVWVMTTQQMLILAGIICLSAAGIIHIRKPK